MYQQKKGNEECNQNLKSYSKYKEDSKIESKECYINMERTDGKRVEKDSLKIVVTKLEVYLGTKVNFVNVEVLKQRMLKGIN
ncbi:unnamed protein product [Paramecium sonneborni]|uniref:Uncharacterized protein n=1 Tax=Paramecium sonneborni TaxID=65129 RepID=A0A8S1PRI8_9CILI|nr:unnamed protein product [Paramecium sonneborni]